MANSNNLYPFCKVRLIIRNGSELDGAALSGPPYTGWSFPFQRLRIDEKGCSHALEQEQSPHL
jgi:hypothetical protein